MSLPQSSIIDQIADHRDELLNENRQLKQRIKRLEEAGDEMVETTTTPAAEAWNKAKEAKAVSEYEHNEHLLDEIDRLRESNFHLRKGCEELKHRITQLEQENDAMRADLLLWEKGEVKP